MVRTEDNRIVRTFRNELLVIEACGADGIRVRATKNRKFNEALPSGIEEESAKKGRYSGKVLRIDEDTYCLQNGRLKCFLYETGRLKFVRDDGSVVLEEYERNRFREKLKGDFYSALEIPPRIYEPIGASDSYAATVHFEAAEGEKIYGMGQYQQPMLNLAGCKLELAQRNSQVTVPFYISNKLYGFLWNNPSIGTVTFASNIIEWQADATPQIDYWVTVGDSPAEIEEHYTELVGRAPKMPEYGLGFWQSKLRYSTQEELLEVAREYHRKKIPVDVIVADFFHWPHQGDWKFDPEYWPDPAAMVRELSDMGMKLMVSVWPTVEEDSENYQEMSDAGYLVQTVNGKNTHILNISGLIDPTNPACREYVWNKLKKNYYDAGIQIFWLDEAEPELTGYEFERYRYYIGSDKQCGNVYPKNYAQLAFDGMKKEGKEEIVTLTRCAWIGSQKYGALVWSGDTDSSYASFKNQIVAGQNIGIAGIPWWNTDLGGFCGADIEDTAFHRLLARWFAFGAFSPVMRLHGFRKPFQDPIGESGGGSTPSGAANEIWSYGTELEEILTFYILLREQLRDYVRETMQEASANGSPVMRPVFYNFPKDAKTWDIKYSYMLGKDILVSPVVEDVDTTWDIYLPEGDNWIDIWSGEERTGGQTVTISVPLYKIPVFVRKTNKALAERLCGFIRQSK